MKNIRYIISAAIVLTIVSCVQEKIDKAAPDREDCIGVYFLEEQENIKTHTLTQGEDETNLEFIVRRTNADTEEYISFDIKAYTISRTALSDTTYKEIEERAEDVFEFGEIYFAKGEKETTLKIWFDDIEIGRTYTCSVEINDPKYASTYNNVSNSITFSVQMYKWNYIGKAIYRDALFSDMFAWDGRYLETEVDIYEREDENSSKTGVYRLDNVYSPSFLARLVEGEEAYNENPDDLEDEYSYYLEADTRIIINASDSSRVYIPAQKTGFSDPSLGDVLIASDVTEVWGANSNLLYGKLSEDGVITLPKNGLLIGIGAYFYFSNSSGKFRLVLPGGKAEDYGIELEAEEVDDQGKIAVTVTPAKDVTKIKYHLFEGKLSDISLENSINKVKNDEVKTQSMDISGEAVLDIQPSDEAETGIYTLVVWSLDSNGECREHSTVQMGYIKPGEEKDIQIYFGITVDDRYENQEFSSENSFQYWIRGKDITHAIYNYYSLSYYNSYKEKIEEDLKKSGSINSAMLKTLNSYEISGVVGNELKPGTDYIFVIYAGNGYRSDFETFQFKTSGKEDLMQKAYYFKDFLTENRKPENYTSTAWVPVSIDVFDAEAKGRTIRGNKRANRVTFQMKNGRMETSGLFPALKENPSIDLDFKDGKLYTAIDTLAEVIVKDSTHIVPSMRFEQKYTPKIGCISGNGYYYDTYESDDDHERYDMLVGGFVHPDIIAFTDNNTEHQFWTLILGGYQEFSDGPGLSNLIGDAHGDLILVREGSELLKSLEESNSTGTPQQQHSLNSVNAAFRIEMPEYNSMIRFDGDSDIAYEKPDYNTPLLEFQDNVKIRTIIK